jgi:hypothetical protein
MKFKSKAHMAQELMSGKRFSDDIDVVVYYDEKLPNPFRYGSNEMIGIWDDYNKDIWTEVKPRHIHQDLIDSYRTGQAWQYLEPHMDGLYKDCKSCSTWIEPSWNTRNKYRLHPHNDLIQAYRNGAKIQVYSNNEWIDIELEPYWYEDSQYRIKPAVKVVYEWLYKTNFSNDWEISPVLKSEEEAKDFFDRCKYKKTGRSWEVEA